jgi:hypothetical protein
MAERATLLGFGGKTPEEIKVWFLADAPKALELQRPLSDNALRIVAKGEKQDGLVAVTV